MQRLTAVFLTRVIAQPCSVREALKTRKGTRLGVEALASHGGNELPVHRNLSRVWIDSKVVLFQHHVQIETEYNPIFRTVGVGPGERYQVCCAQHVLIRFSRDGTPRTVQFKHVFSESIKVLLSLCHAGFWFPELWVSGPQRYAKGQIPACAARFRR